MKPVFLNPSGSCISAFAQDASLHRPTEVLQILINLHRNMLMDIQRPTWWTKQGRLSEISLLNAFGDKGRDPSYATDHNIENYCYSPMKIMYHWSHTETKQQMNPSGWQNLVNKKVILIRTSKIRIWINNNKKKNHLSATSKRSLKAHLKCASLDFQIQEDFGIRKLGKVDGKDVRLQVILSGDVSKHLLRVVSALTYYAQILEESDETETPDDPMFGMTMENTTMLVFSRSVFALSQRRAGELRQLQKHNSKGVWELQQKLRAPLKTSDQEAFWEFRRTSVLFSC